MVEYRAGLCFVNFEPVADGVEVGVVQPVFAKGAGLESLNHDVEVFAE